MYFLLTDVQVAREPALPAPTARTRPTACTQCTLAHSSTPHWACASPANQNVSVISGIRAVGCHSAVFFILPLHVYTAKTQYQKIETNIPSKGIARPQSQFPHLCVCERFIYSHDWSAYSYAGKYVYGPILRIYKSFTDT
jgi:hypothetical protein